MIRFALRLGAGLLAAAVVACVPAPEPAPPAPPPVVAPPPVPNIAAAPYVGASRPIAPRTACTPGNADSFIEHVYILDPTYDPNPPPGRYYPPYSNATQINPTLNPTLTEDLKSAFNNAPLWFQGHLCELRAVYINPASCSNARDYFNNYRCNGLGGSIMQGAWGFRSYHSNSSNGQVDLGEKYISIPAQLWTTANGQPADHAMALNQFENELTGALGPWWQIGQYGPNARPATPNDPWMTVLAAMAHEYGHVHFATTVLPGRVNDPNGPGGTQFAFAQLQNCPGSTGAFDFFGWWDYRNNTRRLFPANRWRNFKGRDTFAGDRIDHRNAPFVGDFEDQHNSVDQKSQWFVDLYNPAQPWASYFGSLAPDEDFVETYVLKVLTNARPRLTHLPISVQFGSGPNQDVDIPGDLAAGRKALLQAKMDCIAQ